MKKHIVKIKPSAIKDPTKGGGGKGDCTPTN
jgi:hypothetical protein